MQVQITNKSNLQVRRSHSAGKPWDHFVHFCLILCSSYLCFFWIGKKQQKLVYMQLEKTKLTTDQQGRDRSIDDSISPWSPPRCITAALPLGTHELLSCTYLYVCRQHFFIYSKVFQNFSDFQNMRNKIFSKMETKDVLNFMYISIVPALM